MIIFLIPFRESNDELKFTDLECVLILLRAHTHTHTTIYTLRNNIYLHLESDIVIDCLSADNNRY